MNNTPLYRETAEQARKEDKLQLWRDSLQAISDGTLQMEKIITHVFAPEEYRQAFETARDKAVFSNKILIEWNK